MKSLKLTIVFSIVLWSMIGKVKLSCTNPKVKKAKYGNIFFYFRVPMVDVLVELIIFYVFQGRLNKIRDLKGDGNKYICKEIGWQPYGCPKLLQIDGILYRFFYTEFTHCAGSISNCVYIARNRDYCMNGIYPSVTPSEIVPHYPQYYQKNMNMKNNTKSSRATHEVVTVLGAPAHGIQFATIEDIGSLSFFQSIYLDVR